MLRPTSQPMVGNEQKPFLSLLSLMLPWRGPQALLESLATSLGRESERIFEAIGLVDLLSELL